MFKVIIKHGGQVKAVWVPWFDVNHDLQESLAYITYPSQAAGLSDLKLPLNEGDQVLVDAGAEYQLVWSGDTEPRGL